MKIRLAKGGIFPIIKKGSVKSTAGYSFSGTIQGEGKLAGVPSLFVRTYGCNLDCVWSDLNDIVTCDTLHSHKSEFDFEEWCVNDIVCVLKENSGNMRHIVITGGEPLLQRKSLLALCKELKKMEMHITLETNATIFDKDVAKYIDLFSLSPKLSNSGKHYGDSRLNRIPNITQLYYDFAKEYNKDIQLKFVFQNQKDIAEIKEKYLSILNYSNEDVLLMPLSSSPSEYQEKLLDTVGVAIKEGWRFSPRLHQTVFGNKENT